MTEPMTLVLGGTGKTGRRIVQRLTARNVPVRIGTRSGGVPFDWSDRSTWAPALDGVGAAYISYYPDLAVPGSADDIQALVDLALSLDVRRLVMLTGRGEEDAMRAEQILQRSAAEWTIVRAAWFNQNFSEDFLLPLVQSGQVVLPSGHVPEPFVDADDIADVATAAFTEEGHVGQIYEVTGPRALTLAEAVTEIAAVAGRDIGYTEVSAEELREELQKEGVPPVMVDLYVYLFAEVLDGRNSATADGVERALGRPPRDFTDFARAAASVWQSVA